MTRRVERSSPPERFTVEVDGVLILTGAHQVEGFDLWDPNTADRASRSQREASLGA